MIPSTASSPVRFVARLARCAVCAEMEEVAAVLLVADLGAGNCEAARLVHVSVHVVCIVDELARIAVRADSEVARDKLDALACFRVSRRVLQQERRRELARQFVAAAVFKRVERRVGVMAEAVSAAAVAAIAAR